jgi:phage repressor protein C with HTH and peptisase S24 domain
MKNNRIRELRVANDVTAAQLARMLDVSGPRLRRWDRQEVTPPHEICRIIGERFNVSAEYVAGDDVPPEPPVLRTRPGAGAMDIPLFGKAAAGEGAVAISDGPVDYIEKPTYLAGVDDCYAVMIVGESMEPRFYPGEVVIVHPYRPVRPGDYAVVQFEKNGELCAIVKRFVTRTETGIRLSQHNPDDQIYIDNSDLRNLHYIKAIRTI